MWRDLGVELEPSRQRRRGWEQRGDPMYPCIELSTEPTLLPQEYQPRWIRVGQRRLDRKCRLMMQLAVLSERPVQILQHMIELLA